METLFENEYVTLRLDRDVALVLVGRKPLPFQVLQDFVAIVDAILTATSRADAANFGLLYDSRQGPPPGGKTYMKASSRMAEELATRFRHVAAIVADSETLEAVRAYAPSAVQFFINEAAARSALAQMARE